MRNMINCVVVYLVTIVAIGHGLLKKFWPLVLGCVLRTAGTSIIRTVLFQEEEGAPSIGSFAGTKRNRSKVDYAASLNFVSAGIAGKEKVNRDCYSSFLV